MIDNDHIYSELTKVFSEVFGVDDLLLTSDTTAGEVDGWDSLNHIRLVLMVQKRFGVKFSAIEISGMKNLGGLVQLIRAKT